MNFGIWFKGLRFKLLLLASVPAAFLITSVYFSRDSLLDLSSSLQKANAVRGPLITYSGEMMLFANSVARWTVTSMWSHADTQERNQALEKAEGRIKDFDETLESYLKLPRSEKAKEIFSAVEKNWPEVKSHLKTVFPLIKSGDAGDLNKAEAYYKNEIRPRVNTIIDTIQTLNDMRKEMMEAELKAENEHVSLVLQMMTLGGVLALIISFTLMVIVLKNIIGSLNGVTHNLVESSHHLSGASHELSSSSTEVASGSSQTAASIQETVASLEELNSIAKNTDQGSQVSLELSQKTQTEARESETKLLELLKALEEISQSSEKITQIIQVIDDISFQTNLLALNAAVEAARAGEQGKGFAVVADAVRTLAHKSASSAKEIGDLIRGSVGKINSGVKIGNECRDSMQNMFDSLKSVATKSEEIAHSTREQTTGMEQISRAMNQLDQATQQNSAASEQISTASNELAQQAHALNDIVIRLKALVDGPSQTQAAADPFNMSSGPSQRVKVPKEKNNESKARPRTPKSDDFGLPEVA